MTLSNETQAALDLVADESAALEQIDQARERQRRARDEAIEAAAARQEVTIDQVAAQAGVSRVQIHRIIDALARRRLPQDRGNRAA